MTEGEALILAVASRSRNLELMSKLLEEAGYSVLTADNVDEFDKFLEEADRVALTVLDIDGFTTEIWNCCERLQEMNVPILVLAKRLPSAVKQKALSMGARNLIEKPVRKAELRESVQALVAAQ